VTRRINYKWWKASQLNFWYLKPRVGFCSIYSTSNNVLRRMIARGPLAMETGKIHRKSLPQRLSYLITRISNPPMSALLLIISVSLSKVQLPFPPSRLPSGPKSLIVNWTVSPLDGRFQGIGRDHSPERKAVRQRRTSRTR
jgi:hypothetical protein